MKQVAEKQYSVSVYRNLTKKCWSIRTSFDTVRHVDRITLHKVSFNVNQRARERVKKSRQKNVHAFATVNITKTLLDLFASRQRKRGGDDLASWEKVSYCPYKAGFFFLSGEVSRCR